MNILDVVESNRKKNLTKNSNSLKPCSRRNSENFIIKRTINNDGKECFPYYCTDCGNRTPIAERKEVVEALGAL